MVGLFANIGCLLVAPVLLLIVYPGTGIVLSRFIGRRIIWWKFGANLQTMSAAKIQVVLTWPISIPSFVARVFGVRFL
jgi:hypothetical protein